MNEGGVKGEKVHGITPFLEVKFPYFAIRDNG
jgi:hypothetical protein